MPLTEYHRSIIADRSSMPAIPDPTAAESSAIDSETGELLHPIRWVPVKDSRAPTVAELEGGTFLGWGKFNDEGWATLFGGEKP